jgi:hypothetical protein
MDEEDRRPGRIEALALVGEKDALAAARQIHG